MHRLREKSVRISAPPVSTEPQSNTEYTIVPSYFSDKCLKTKLKKKDTQGKTSD